MGAFNTGSDNTAVGQATMFNKTSGNYNVAVGSNSLQLNITGSSNTAIGKNSGLFNTGDNNVFIGRSAGGSNTGSNNVFIGYLAGSISSSVSNRLYIANSATTNPLIYGEFDNSFLKINGKLQATDTVTATTMGITDSSDRIATTKWVKQRIDGIVSGTYWPLSGNT